MRIVEEIDQELNPKLFMGDKLKPEVRDRLMDIAKEFTNTIAEDLDYKVLDVIMVGSQAGYTYTDHSDIDLHLIVNLSQISRENPEIVQYLFNSERSRFNSNYDITVKGIEVEIYVEDLRTSTRSNGVYSVMNDEWIKVPSKDVTKRTVDIDWETQSEFNDLVNEINQVLDSGTAEDIQDMVNKIYMYRKNGLAAEGELSEGNLIFKEIRNRGYLDKLKSQYYEVRSNELTLEGIIIEEI